MDVNDITISFWYKGDIGIMSADTQPEPLISFKTNFGHIAVPSPTTNSLGDEIHFNYKNANIVAESLAPADWQGAWHHYAFIKDPAKGLQAIYRDGVLLTKTLFNDDLVSSRWWQIELEATGRIDEMKIYNTALSQEDVLYLAGVASVNQPLVAQSDGNGDQVVDIIDLHNMASIWLEEILFPLP